MIKLLTKLHYQPHQLIREDLDYYQFNNILNLEFHQHEKALNALEIIEIERVMVLINLNLTFKFRPIIFSKND